MDEVPVFAVPLFYVGDKEFQIRYDLNVTGAKVIEYGEKTFFYFYGSCCFFITHRQDLKIGGGDKAIIGIIVPFLVDKVRLDTETSGFGMLQPLREGKQVEVGRYFLDAGYAYLHSGVLLFISTRIVIVGAFDGVLYEVVIHCSVLSCQKIRDCS